MTVCVPIIRTQTIRACAVCVAVLLLLPLARASHGQVAPQRDAFKQLDLPAPNEYRSASGKPGPAYWQQRADYDIKVTLDPAAKTISGSETIRYTNNSPDTLEFLWIQLDQNLFRPGSRGAEIQPPDSRWRGSFEGGGIEIINLRVDGVAPEFLITDTRLRIDLDNPMPPGGSSVDISMDFSFRIPEYGADRMGWLEVEQGTVFELAQWYPRMYVYDDVNGWNPMPYLGQGEFYLEYGDFNIEYTVPRDFIVASTGVLQNPEEVLTAEQRNRLDEARTSAETVMIIRPEEVGSANTRPSGPDMLTWRFRAENVRDVAWAASDAFIWDAAGWKHVLNMSYYPREGLGTPENPGWEKSTEYVLHSIRHYSEMWYEYPYPVAINVAGIVGGMEYPMIVFCSVRARDHALFGVTTHEIGHEWYPMVVGSDERRHAWMDEGFNTMINYYSALDYYGDAADQNRYVVALTSDYISGMMTQSVDKAPVYTHPDLIPRSDLGFLAYRKPGAALRVLREYVLGPDRFDEALREYTVRWAYKHPQPADFFRTMEDVTGEDLDWFWRAWLLETNVLDQRIADVSHEDGQARVTVEQQAGGMILPVDLEIVYVDGRKESRRMPVEAFIHSNSFTTVLEGSIQSVTLDPRQVLPDVDRANNVWTAASGSH